MLQHPDTVPRCYHCCRAFHNLDAELADVPHYKAEVVVAHFNDNLSWVSHGYLRLQLNAGRALYKGGLYLWNGAARMHKDMGHS